MHSAHLRRSHTTALLFGCLLPPCCNLRKPPDTLAVSWRVRALVADSVSICLIQKPCSREFVRDVLPKKLINKHKSEA